MQILGIDYGDSRIGVAKSDAMGWLAQGLETIKNNGGNRKPIERIAEIVKQYDENDNLVYERGPRPEDIKEYRQFCADHVPAFARSHSEELWHYTDANGLIGILKRDKSGPHKSVA